MACWDRRVEKVYFREDILKESKFEEKKLRRRKEGVVSAMPQQNSYMANSAALEKSMSDFWDSSTA